MEIPPHEPRRELRGEDEKMKGCIGLNEAGMQTLRDLLAHALKDGVDLSDRTLNAWANKVDIDRNPGHLEIGSSYTSDGIPRTYMFEDSELKFEEFQEEENE